MELHNCTLFFCCCFLIIILFNYLYACTHVCINLYMCIWFKCHLYVFYSSGSNSISFKRQTTAIIITTTTGVENLKACYNEIFDFCGKMQINVMLEWQVTAADNDGFSGGDDDRKTQKKIEFNHKTYIRFQVKIKR